MLTNATLDWGPSWAGTLAGGRARQGGRREEVHVAHTVLFPHSPPPKAGLTVTLSHPPHARPLQLTSH